MERRQYALVDGQVTRGNDEDIIMWFTKTLGKFALIAFMGLDLNPMFRSSGRIFAE